MVLTLSRNGGGNPAPLLTVFILAAGLGERLRPITNQIPKPLLPILGMPVLELVLKKVSPFANAIGINLHHKKELIAEYINHSAFKGRTTVFYEEPILGTGGALKNAEGFLSKGTFLVHNADILSDMDLGKLIEFHKSSGSIATLAVHDEPKFNNLIIGKDGYLAGIFHSHIRLAYAADSPVSKPSGWEAFRGNGFAAGESAAINRKGGDRFENLKAFTGIAVYEPEFLNFLPQGVSKVTDVWLKAVGAGCRIGVMDVSGTYWTDIGTPSAYASAVVNALRDSGETIYIHPDSDISEDTELDGYVVIEKGCRLSGIKSLQNCIMLGTNLKSVPIESGEHLLIGVGGSDRRYFRRKNGKDTEVFVRYGKNDADFNRHIEYTRFFRKYNIPVPELMDADYENMTAVFEDLGDLSLYSYLKCKRKPEQIEEIYKKVIDILTELHALASSHINECPMFAERIFDYEHARWETNYFIEQFVKGIKGMDIKDMAELNEEFHKLAKRMDSFPKIIIHRDFQSQNIMLKKGLPPNVSVGGAPRLIDYQGARLGPPAYDLASILYDPYFRLEDRMREILLDYYISQMGKRLGSEFKKSDCIESLAVCRLQRHMQALGAYGFLSNKKGKLYFLKHVPEGIRLLREDIQSVRTEYPVLHELIMNL